MADVNQRLTRLERVAEDLQIQMANINESLNVALQNMLPKVEALLCSVDESSRSRRAVAGDQSASRASWALLRDATGLTPLHLAASAGHSHAVQRLAADAGAAHVDVLAPRRRTALHLCAAHGHAPVAQILIAAGAALDVRDVDGRTPLMLAAAAGSAPVAEVLLRGGADANVCDNGGKSALDIATAAGFRDVVAVLREKTSASNESNNGEKKITLLEATKEGDAEAITQILQSGSEYDDTIYDPLSWVKEHSCLWAYEYARPGILWSECGAIAFRTAARAGRQHSMLLLLGAGLNIDEQNPNGMTALMWTCVSNQLQCCKSLIERGASLDITDEDGNTPAHHAAYHENMACLTALWKAGANIRIRNKRRMFPYLIARDNGYAHIFYQDD